MKRRFSTAMALATAVFALPAPVAEATAPGPAGKLGVFGSFQARTMNPDGKTQTALPIARSDYTFSADGAQLVYGIVESSGERISYRVDSKRIEKQSVAGGTPEVIVELAHDGNPTNPSLTPDASKVAFVDEGQINLVNADGSGRTDLVPGSTTGESEPVFSPDGNAIVFSRSGDLWRIGANGTNLTQLTNEAAPVVETSPDFSPSGDRIVYERRADPNDPNALEDLYSIAPDGSGRTQLTDDPSARELDPEYAPDGSAIAYTSLGPTDSVRGVSIMNPDGSGQHRVTSTETELVDWSVIPPDEPVACAGRTADIVGAGVGPLTGSIASEVIAGGAGRQKIRGDFGTDRICGGPGNDLLIGGAGRDLLVGQGGRDTLKGQAGRDRCVGGQAHDRARGCERTAGIP